MRAPAYLERNRHLQDRNLVSHNPLDFDGEGPIEKPKQGDSQKLNDVARGCVISVVERFGQLTGPQLIRLTHDMDPWFNAYVPGHYRTVIEPQAIYDYFAQAPSTEQLAEALSAWNVATGGKRAVA